MFLKKNVELNLEKMSLKLDLQLFWIKKKTYVKIFF